MKRIMIAYVPVIHAGYMKLFKKYADKVDYLYIFSEEYLDKNMYIAKEIRACDPYDAVRMIGAFGFFSAVGFLDKNNLCWINECDQLEIIMTNDEFSRQFAAQYLPGKTPTFEDVFLRWDESSVNSAVEVKCDRLSVLPHDRYLMYRAQGEAKKSSCWWRHVGAVVVNPATGKVVLAAHNKHMPSEHTPYAVGDPRDFVKAGTSPEIAATIHAEPTIIAMAAKEGIALKGMHMYITVFPCGPCASIIAESGIAKLFFASGCAYLNGDVVLHSRGVEIIHTEPLPWYH